MAAATAAALSRSQQRPKVQPFGSGGAVVCLHQASPAIPVLGGSSGVGGGRWEWSRPRRYDPTSMDDSVIDLRHVAFFQKLYFDLYFTVKTNCSSASSIFIMLHEQIERSSPVSMFADDIRYDSVDHQRPHARHQWMNDGKCGSSHDWCRLAL